jgi:Glycosyltransferase sugar-binding region containing DXD motif
MNRGTTQNFETASNKPDKKCLCKSTLIDQLYFQVENKAVVVVVVVAAPATMEIRSEPRSSLSKPKNTTEKYSNKKSSRPMPTSKWGLIVLCATGLFFLGWQVTTSNDDYGHGSLLSSSLPSSSTFKTQSTGFVSAATSSKSKSGLRVPVFYPKSDRHLHNNNNNDDLWETGTQAMLSKLEEDISLSSVVSDVVALDPENPPYFINKCAGGDATERLKVLRQSKQPHLASELLKYCALQYHRGGLYIDSQSALTSTLDHILAKTTSVIRPDGTVQVLPGQSQHNLAVINDPKVAPNSIHGALFYIVPYDKSSSNSVVDGMIEVLMTTNIKVLESSPLLLPKSLYDFVAAHARVATLSAGLTVGGASGATGNNDIYNKNWYLLQHTCTLYALGQREVTTPVSSYALNSYRLTQNCPEPNGFCCSIFDPVAHSPAMMTKHMLLPYQILPSASDLPRPINAEAGHYDEDDLPFISTISEVVHTRPEEPLLTPNFFETLLQNDCLPSDKKCSDCLRNKQGANCRHCASVCPCYCKTLCHIPVEDKFVSKSITVKPPLYARDPSRLIPRIIHQTFFEDVTSEKYPNMSRLVESFKQSGWVYRFYDDDTSLNFLSTHFPPEVRQAYEALRPGAFKADLFRYCVLLIYGGVYADVDIMLESSLDHAIGPDVGFMVPQDEPGTPIGKRMCLWNGMIAAAPGHPFLAKVIETVVNNVRNRFTSVDNDAMFCPDPELSILHAFDTLFTAGPCILGAMVNKVLGRHGQTPFKAGEIDLWEASKEAALEKGTEFVIGVGDKRSKKLPGRTIILHQNKWDMGSHRFTLLDKNLVVASTDLPEADDRANQEKPPEHYSKVRNIQRIEGGGFANLKHFSSVFLPMLLCLYLKENMLTP